MPILTVGTARYIMITQDMALESSKSEMAPVAIPPVRKGKEMITPKLTRVCQERWGANLSEYICTCS